MKIWRLLLSKFWNDRTIFKIKFIKKVDLSKNTKDYLSNEIDDKVSVFALKEKRLIVWWR